MIFFYFLKEPLLFLLVLGIVNRNYKTRLLPGIYSYTFSFTLKSATTLLQKLATFYICNVKQKMIEWTNTHSTAVMVTT